MFKLASFLLLTMFFTNSAYAIFFDIENESKIRTLHPSLKRFITEHKTEDGKIKNTIFLIRCDGDEAIEIAGFPHLEIVDNNLIRVYKDSGSLDAYGRRSYTFELEASGTYDNRIYATLTYRYEENSKNEEVLTTEASNSITINADMIKPFDGKNVATEELFELNVSLKPNSSYEGRSSCKISTWK